MMSRAAKIAFVVLLVAVGSAGAAGRPSSAPSFKAPRDFDASMKAGEGVALGDLNGDGKLDVVEAHGTDFPPELQGLRGVSVLLGRGDGRFGPSHAYPTGKAGDELGAWSLALGDVTGDGRPDVATGNPGAKSVSVLVNDGRGRFAAPVNYPLHRQPWDIAIVDLNGDDKLDITTANQNTVSVLLNRGDGTFQEPFEYPGGRNTWGLAVGDLNGDGKLDLALANNTGSTVSVLLNRGDGSFGSAVDYPSGPGPRAIAMGDVDGDGIADVITANGSSDPYREEWLDSVSVLRGKGDGTLRPKRTYRSRGELEFTSVRIGDMNGDHKPDLVTANASDDWALSVFVNGGKGTFRRHFEYGWLSSTSNEAGSGSEAVALGDLNGDRRLDVVEALWDEVSVYVRAPGFCTVPYVESIQLSVAKKRLAERHCRIGKIRWRPGGVRGVVRSQRPWMGTVLSKGGKVDLVVSTGRAS
jgi:FG-GAP-like repeat/FG-GAP repeat